MVNILQRRVTCFIFVQIDTGVKIVSSVNEERNTDRNILIKIPRPGMLGSKFDLHFSQKLH